MTDTPRSEPTLAERLANDMLDGEDAGLSEVTLAEYLIDHGWTRAARQPVADTSGLRAAMRDALSKAHTAKDIDRFLDDYFPFAALSGTTPEATAPGLDAVDRLQSVLDSGCWPSGLEVSISERRAIEHNLARLTEPQGSGS